MGLCHGKPASAESCDPFSSPSHKKKEEEATKKETEAEAGATVTEEKAPRPWASPFFPFYSPSPAHSLFAKKSPSAASQGGGSATSTPGRFFKRPFPPPSPAKHIRAVLARRLGSVKPNEAAIPADEREERRAAAGLDKSFGFSKGLASKYEIGEEVGRGHFGYTCTAKVKKGESKGQQVAVKVIPKAKMTTAIAIEDVRREVKILRALMGHNNLVHFYDAYEDNENVYIIMELCEGGELLDRILSRGGTYSENDAKAVMLQILNVVAFCHLQGVVHRDLKPENFLFTSKDENSQLKAIDFGLSDFVKPDERLNDIVGSAYYVAPEVLHRSYSTEADVWSIGVIAYILLCGSRPFWARTESGIFRAVLKADPSFTEPPWPSISPEAKDFVKRLLSKDPRRRMTAAQALCHPWIRNYNDIKVPLDILVFRLIKSYLRSSSLRKAALRALMKNVTDQMKESHVQDILVSLGALQYRRMDFDEFCAATLSVHQLEGLDRWEQHARCAYELFEKDGNRAIVIEELASNCFPSSAISLPMLAHDQHGLLLTRIGELGLSPSVPVHVVLRDWIRHTDGKLSFLGFVKLLHGVSSRSAQSLAKAR
ncbi:CDPK-related protein [Musa troglodytarum]|uniref:CDPK-related protein n=1 Tax=Musa troglodytarum TaxID=320322 RepID=A0A9E7JKY8_9LILI|nr:CDPK-related protein [Musa troglodytarum]